VLDNTFSGTFERAYRGAMVAEEAERTSSGFRRIPGHRGCRSERIECNTPKYGGRPWRPIAWAQALRQRGREQAKDTGAGSKSSE